MKSSVPTAAWVFVAVLVLATILLIGGVLVGVKALLVVGAVTLGFLILLLLVGAAC
jgi:hypothetical protein